MLQLCNSEYLMIIILSSHIPPQEFNNYQVNIVKKKKNPLHTSYIHYHKFDEIKKKLRQQLKREETLLELELFD